MTLEECCALARGLTRVPVTCLQTAADRAAFCGTHQFHPMQEYLLPQVLETLLDGVLPGEVVLARDLFGVRFAFCRIDHVPLAVGPFCTEFFSLNDCEILLRRLGLKNFAPRELVARRGQLPVCSENGPLHTLRCMARAMGAPVPETVRRLDEETERTVTFRDVTSPTTYAELVHERYLLEQTMMEAVRQGDTAKAVESWQALHHSVAFLKHLGQTLETARIAAGITRTVIRMAATQAGIPDVVNDNISGASAAIIRKAQTIEEIDREHERLLREYCQLIRRKQHSGYSNLVLGVLCRLEHQYDRPVTVAELAREQGVTPNYLTAQFKKEVGKTPLACLNQLRMRRAAQQLARTKDSVQEIAASVGILDANYFVKRFKAEFGYTPTEFRRRYCV